ncbi:uncharacterized protein [Littorina saxatilis]|uniref:uncharacterized protein n=1 Tax=Littorina saxatilis TaxID=31220 RepID=UPI0038B500D5
MINPYRFQILTNGSIRKLIVADILPKIEEPTSTFVDQLAVCSTSKFGHNDPPNDLKEIFVVCDEKMPNHRNQMCECGEDAAGCAVHASVPFIQNTTTSSPSTQNRSITSRKNKPASESPQVRSLTKAQKEKLLIFTFGEVCFHSHMVGIKRMREDEILEEEEAREGLRWPETEEGFLPHTHSDVGGTGRLSNPDYSFNMYGSIIGMALSPDQRYLYVNTRRWAEDYVIDDETEPPLADEIDINIISLMTFTKVDTVLRSHKAFPGANFWFALDVNELYVTSGSGDNQGYMWDRHYGVHVRCFPHDNVVNSCAFNPVDPEMLVTGSDDNSIKIWRSRRQMREVTEKKTVYKYETATPATVADESCLEGRDNSDTLSGRRETTREDCNCSFLFCCFRK